ncbi:inositol monophosphatase family protein [Streptomyces sp. TRM 70351]|uniref:inositol monophosphatase family protein n=1 Tax=Streptomyces sp. TRM 70351 TaxID=3116552 RepID=UPI002E7BACE8|nr:inositol monophosphatase family protein [Streptomyces sp. TRM 70351]MEE1926909.1 inositol monophosphatase family protein [Streptomyces sp. TRM 70351]
MIDAALTAGVEAAVRKAAAEEIMPRWRQLADEDVTQKAGPHDLVTIADRRAEAHLAATLPALLPGSAFVGEEGVHADPGMLAALGGDAPVWIVDPVDGTRQFVRGEDGFATLVALAHRGELLASWTYLPVRDVMATARRGGGALLDGRPLRSGQPSPGAVLEVATDHPDYVEEERLRPLLRLRTPGVAPRPCGSAGLEYLHVATGALDAIAFGWENAWDHAAGLLLVTEAGGAHATADGGTFDVTGHNALPFAAARDEPTLRRILSLLAGPDPEEAQGLRPGRG